MGCSPLPPVLHQHGARGESGGVGVHHEWQLGVGQRENRALLQSQLQFVEGLLLGGAPVEPHSVLGQLGQWCRDGAEVANEFAVVSRCAEEGAHVADL